MNTNKLPLRNWHCTRIIQKRAKFLDALYALIKKEFLEGEPENIRIPEHSKKIMADFIARNDYKHKVYSDKIVHFFSNKSVYFSHAYTLFEVNPSISELNKLGVVHKCMTI